MTSINAVFYTFSCCRSKFFSDFKSFLILFFSLFSFINAVVDLMKWILLTAFLFGWFVYELLLYLASYVLFSYRLCAPVYLLSSVLMIVMMDMVRDLYILLFDLIDGGVDNHDDWQTIFSFNCYFTIESFDFLIFRLIFFFFE